MSSEFGNKFKVQLFGQSHSEAIGAVIEGIPAGFVPDISEIESFLKRRIPADAVYSSGRQEQDSFQIVSGLFNGYATGDPLCVLFGNNDRNSDDYSDFRAVPRPSHSDLPLMIQRNGFNDYRGGGHSSGRLTAPLCFAGAIALQILKKNHIKIKAHALSIGKIFDKSFDFVNPLDNLDLNDKYPVISQNVLQNMLACIRETREKGDSLGGIIECAVDGLAAGFGSPMFDGIENRISQSVFAVPSVKGIEFGSGFNGALSTGSENNDSFYLDTVVKTKTNNHGGILGGISSGMPIIFRAAVKPVPSISLPQQTVDLYKNEHTEIEIKGRHDTCIVFRAVPAIESAAAIVIADLILGG